jgi:transcriptional regulator with GAF, ATPase, and Fis domain
LFGHEKGAFTDAVQRRLGRFELAEDGTLFLDEVGDLPAESQIALLRVLQEREFERVGGHQPIQADVRVIAATHVDLQAAVANGKCRCDLFYRLNVFPINVPPLRERATDIPLLVECFVSRYAATLGKKINHIHKNTMDRLKAYPWPGNIRELQNVIERSVIVAENGELSVDESWISGSADKLVPPQGPLSRKSNSEIKTTIEAALVETRGRVSGPSGAAAKLGVPGSTLESKIKSLKISKQNFFTCAKGAPAT